MKRSRILLIFALIIAIIYIAVDKIYKNKEYAINTLSESEVLKADGFQLNRGEERYTTTVYLNSNGNNLPAVLELEVISKVVYDKVKKTYVLEEPNIKVNALGCKVEEANGNRVEDTKVSGYYRFSVDEDSEFTSSMYVKTAKELIENNKISDVKINKSLNSNIESLELLEKSTRGDEEISLTYKTTGEAFDIWYEISFFIDENKTGYFKVF